MAEVVAIHQPNFFPWLGYFDKIVRSDVFVFFDDAQFPKTGGTWSNRVKLLINSEACWVTAAIDRKYRGTRTIHEMSFLLGKPWRAKSLASIEQNYRNHPFYSETIDLIAPLLLNREANVAEYNIQAIMAISDRLGLGPDRLKRSSVLLHEGSASDLLCSLTLAAGGSTYMCGGGADGYQDDAVFEQRGVTLRYQSFSQPVYPQRGGEDFVSGLSIIDAAMNLGWVGVRSLLNNSGC